MRTVIVIVKKGHIVLKNRQVFVYIYPYSDIPLASAYTRFTIKHYPWPLVMTSDFIVSIARVISQESK